MLVEDFHWLVGLLEGEGTFMFGAPSSPNNPVVRLQMTDEDVVARAAALMGVGYLALKARNSRCKPSFVCALKGKPAIDLMSLLLPYMSARRSSRIVAIVTAYEGDGRRKLTDKAVHEVRERSLTGESMHSLAKEYSCSYSTVKSIKYGLRHAPVA